MNMKAVVAAQFNGTITKAIERYSKLEKTDSLQISIGLNPDGTPKIILYKDFKLTTPLSVITTLQLLGVKIDFMGKEGLVNMFLPKILTRLAEEKKIPLDTLNLLCFAKEKKLIIFAMNATAYVEQIKLEEALSDADFQLA
jgi:hypothetical protein